MSSNQNGCREVVASLIGKTGYQLCVPGKCKLISLCIGFDDGASADRFIWVWDLPAVPASQGDMPLTNTPIVPPFKVSAGDFKSLAPPTRWIPIESGILVGLSSSDTDFTIDSSNLFNVSWHIAL